MATIPDATPSDAMPLCDVNGGYLGYLDDSTFYPQMRMAQAIGAGAAAGGVNWGGSA